MKKLRISSLEETKHLAEKIATYANVGTLITLKGDLGAGKTTFTKAFGKVLGIQKTINSPTFTILKIYRDGRLPLYHIDAYRLEGISQDLGFSDYYEGDGVCIVEWPDFVEEELPKARLELSIYRMDEQEGREFVINGIGEHYKEIEEAVYENIMHG